MRQEQGTSIASWALREGGMEVVAYMGERRVGQLDVGRVHEDDLMPHCLAALRRLRRAVRDDSVGVLRVGNAWLEEHARGRGIGVSLYREAARLARNRFHAALAPDQCSGGSTSASARRVWESERFALHVEIYGPLVWSTELPDFDDPDESALAHKVAARRGQ